MAPRTAPVTPPIACFETLTFGPSPLVLREVAFFDFLAMSCSPCVEIGDVAAAGEMRAADCIIIAVEGAGAQVVRLEWHRAPRQAN